jgi:hypothetical protein
MDQGPLVIERIDAGMEFINRIDEHVGVETQGRANTRTSVSRFAHTSN